MLGLERASKIGVGLLEEWRRQYGGYGDGEMVRNMGGAALTAVQWARDEVVAGSVALSQSCAARRGEAKQRDDRESWRK